MDREMDKEWMDGWMNVNKQKRKYGQLYQRMEEWIVNGWIDGLIERCIKGWRSKRVGGQIDVGIDGVERWTD